MDQEIKAKWVKALRSGEYTQTQNRYYSPETGGYCCLGVLSCVMAGRPMHEEASTQLSSQGMGTLADALVAMNDGGKSFAEIADHIEAHL